MRPRPKIYVKDYQVYLAVTLLVLVGLSFLVRLTPLVKIYWINQITSLIADNQLSLLIITGLLISIYFVEMQIVRKKIEDENEHGD